jgi:hypothetical protein
MHRQLQQALAAPLPAPLLLQRLQLLLRLPWRSMQRCWLLLLLLLGQSSPLQLLQCQQLQLAQLRCLSPCRQS